jgi:ribosome maturation factor RimP
VDYEPLRIVPPDNMDRIKFQPWTRLILEWAAGPFFLRQSWISVKSSERQFADMFEPTIKALGLELWGIEFQSRGKQSVLRVFIESAMGVTVEDCETVSRQLSGILDVEDPIGGEYRLEVSSPGMDRRLFTLQQFAEFVGSTVSIKLRQAVEGRRKIKGTILKVKDGNIFVKEDDREIEFPFIEVERANIVF